MKNISEDIKNALKNEAVTTTARITVLPDNTVIDGNNLSSVKIVDKCYNEGVIIGTSMCKEVEIEIINNNYQLENKEFILEVGVLLENGTYEYISYGNFIVKEYNDLKSNNRYKIIAYDYMDKLNVVFEDNYDYSTPITLQEFYENFADFYGIEFVEQTLPNQNFSIIKKPYFENMTGRVVLSRISEMFGSFAKFNSENKLEMYLTNTINEQITRNEMNSSLEINNMFGPINIVALRLSDVEGENVTLRDEDSILTYGEKTLQIFDNPFTYTQALREAAIQGIYDRVKGFSYYPTKFNSKLIYFDCGDIVNVQDMKTDNFYTTMILNQTLQVPNTIKCKFENSALTDNGLKYQFVSEQAAKNRRTEYLIDKQNQTIQQIVEKTTEFEENSIYGIEVLYALSSSETQPPTEGWSATAPAWTEGKYMWQKTVTIYADGSAKESEPTNISGSKGKDGKDGEDGKDGSNGSDGKSSYQIWLEAGNVGTEAEYLESLKGKDGTSGEDGVGISSIISEYYLSTSDITQTGGSWAVTQQEWEDGNYFWTRSKITWTDGTTTYTTPVLAEGLNNANESASTAQQLIAEQKITLTDITNTVSETVTRLNNDYMTLEETQGQIDNINDNISTIQTTQTTLQQTASSLKIQIDNINENGVSKVRTTMGYTFDDSGFKLDRTGAETGTIIDEAAIQVLDKTGSEPTDLLYAGYVQQDNEKYEKYIGQTIVAAANMIVRNYMVVPNSRFEAYVNPALGGKGTGVFGV